MAKLKCRAPRIPRRPFKTTDCNHRAYSRNVPWEKTEGALQLPELRWMDRLLRSFSRETPQDWLPTQYQSMLNHEQGRKRILH